MALFGRYRPTAALSLSAMLAAIGRGSGLCLRLALNLGVNPKFGRSLRPKVAAQRSNKDRIGRYPIQLIDNLARI